MNILQNMYEYDKWKVAIVPIFLVLNNYTSALNTLKRFFDVYPTPESVACSSIDKISDIVKSTGMVTKRSRAIYEMSCKWIQGRRPDMEHFYFFGRYVLDSYTIFVNNNIDIEPTDRVLIEYVKYKRSSI